MKLAIISFAREDSKRLPKKNTMLLNGKPLIWYTLQTMKYLEKQKEWYYLIDRSFLDYYVLTDYKECQDICEKESIKIIWRDHPKEWDDIRLNQWAHEKINADVYLLLQLTSPFRDNKKIDEWFYFCINNEKIKSSFSVTKINDLIFKRNGLFFYYTKEQLETGKLNDENSLIFQGFDIDINTIDDFKRAEEYANKNYSGTVL